MNKMTIDQALEEMEYIEAIERKHGFPIQTGINRTLYLYSFASLSDFGLRYVRPTEEEYLAQLNASGSMENKTI